MFEHICLLLSRLIDKMERCENWLVIFSWIFEDFPPLPWQVQRHPDLRSCVQYLFVTPSPKPSSFLCPQHSDISHWHLLAWVFLNHLCWAWSSHWKLRPYSVWNFVDAFLWRECNICFHVLFFLELLLFRSWISYINLYFSDLCSTFSNLWFIDFYFLMWKEFLNCITQFFHWKISVLI